MLLVQGPHFEDPRLKKKKVNQLTLRFVCVAGRGVEFCSGH